MTTDRQSPDSSPGTAAASGTVAAAPAASGEQSSPLLHTILAFSFGIAFVSALLIFAVFFPEPTVFQEFVFRTVLSLAAAGVAVVIPGMLQLKLGNWLTAGGALAVFLIVFWFNPPELVKPLRAAQLNERANLAMMTGNHAIAKSLLKEAIKLEPDDPNYHNALAQAEYSLGNYATAKSLYESAYDKSGTSERTRDRTYLYSLSLIYEFQEQFDDALKNFAPIKSTQIIGSDVWNEITFSEGRLYLKKALRDQIDEDMLNKSKDRFSSFLENGGTPTQWAKYHLACIQAVLASKYSLVEKRTQEINNQILVQVSEVISEIKNFRGETAKDHYQMILHLLKPSAFYPWRPGYPVECPILQALIKQNYGKIQISNLILD